MDPTAEFFAKLKKLAVTLESETGRLQQVFESRKSEDDTDTTATAMRAYHEVNCDVGNLKGQIQEQLVQQKAKEKEVNSFIKECKMMEERISQDIHTLKERWEKYGYQGQKDTQKPASTNCHESATEDKMENEAKTGGGGSDEDEPKDAGDVQPTSPPVDGRPPVTDGLRTPQLSDFGLSEMVLKKGLAGSDWCEPPAPQISLPRPFGTPGPPPMPVTPKCALWLDDDEPQTPKLQEFAISEPTLCLLNDFTMDLFKKNAQKPQRPIEDISVPVNLKLETLQVKDDLESPELPELSAPGFQIKKAKCSRDPPTQINGTPVSATLRGETATTPEIPALKTPYLKHLVSAKKLGPTGAQASDGSHVSAPLLPPLKGSMSFAGVEEQQMPVMPHLESALANSLHGKSTNVVKNGGEHEGLSRVYGLELDGRTQEFNLGTPRLRMELEDPSTPEMPDLSSITQDICKLVSQAQLKKTAMMATRPDIRTDKIDLHKAVSMVSDSEFQSLPNYLKLTTLHNLNQAVHNINTFMADHPGEREEFPIEELQRIINAGTKTPVYILCLTELKRLTHVGGVKNTSVYKLNVHS
ncbi:spindle and kinetochore-associated protein 3 isoform X2 [Takifugu flavidus]|uniref:spindle and kinetochore-associated protein 3 isoform X2 n=1 Tax=Takifugu flavidus TaxID=433684 RepID=UPI002544A414|nr:spindle and kinetochore-associated protein 3 isoform X2 [Takifugu flavidus]